MTVVASANYPEASEMLVKFPAKWELVHHLSREDSPLYIGGMPALGQGPPSPPDRPLWRLSPALRLLRGLAALWAVARP